MQELQFAERLFGNCDESTRADTSRKVLSINTFLDSYKETIADLAELDNGERIYPIIQNGGR